VRLVIERVRYKAVDAEGNTDVITTAMPNEMLPGALAAPSLAAHVIMENVGKGLPLFRLEDAFTRDGVGIDRGTLSRWKKRVGDSLLSTVVHAMQQHARETAFCISTDATGVCVQPLYDRAKGGQPCKKGHFLVMIADRDHILFDYLESENAQEHRDGPLPSAREEMGEARQREAWSVTRPLASQFLLLKPS
jgi:hypothetical protein